MLKLLQAYDRDMTDGNARKLRAYDRAHPMSACLLTRVQADLLADAIHQANNPKGSV